MTGRTEFAAPRLKHFANLALLVAAAAGTAVAMAVYRSEIGPLAVVMALVLYGIVKLARIPYRITLREERMALKSVLGEATLAPDEVTEVEAQSFGYYVHFNTRRGRFVLLGSTAGLRELVGWIRSRNAALVVRGLP